MGTSYQQLSLEERCEIARLQADGRSIRQIAVRLSKFCGNGPNLWLSMQAAYDLWHAERHLAREVAKIPTARAA